MKIKDFVQKCTIEQRIDHSKDGAPLYTLQLDRGFPQFTGTLDECMAYLQLNFWQLNGISEIKGRHISVAGSYEGGIYDN
jgi:hypothetical protein